MSREGEGMIFKEGWVLCLEVVEQELRCLWYRSKGKNRIVPSSVAFRKISLPPGVVEQGQIRQREKLTEILNEQVRMQIPLRKTNESVSVNLALAGHGLFIQEYHLPWTKKKERKGMLKYLAEEEIPIPPEDLLYEYSIIEDKENKRLRVLLAGIRKKYLYSLVDILQESGFLVKEVRVSLLAWKNLLGLRDGEITLIVLEENAQIHLIIYKGETPQLIRAFELQRLLFYLETFEGGIDVQQILMGSGEKTKEIGKAIQDILTRHLGKPPILQDLVQALEDSLKVFSQVFSYSLPGSSPWQNILKENPVEEVLACMGLSGLDIVGKNNYEIDFWRHFHAYRRNQLQKQIGAGFLLMTMMATTLLFFYTHQTSHALQNEILLLRQLEAKEMAQQEDSLRPLYSWQSAENKKTAVGQKLGSLLALKNENLQLVKIEIKGTSLVIEGNTGEALVVPRLFQQLRELEWEDIQLINYEFSGAPQTNSSLFLPIKFALQAEKRKVVEP